MQYKFGYEDEPNPPEPLPDGSPYPDPAVLTVVGPEDDDPDE